MKEKAQEIIYSKSKKAEFYEKDKLLAKYEHGFN